MRPTRNSREEDARRRRRRKRKQKEALGKIIPVVVALLLIVVVVLIFFGTKLKNKYEYSGEYADLKEYFSIYYPYNVALVINNEKVEETAVYYNDTVYFSEADTAKYFTDHFYIETENDESNAQTNEKDKKKTAYYTTADEIITAAVNQSGNYTYERGGQSISLTSAPVITNDGQTYFSIEFLKLFADFSYQFYNDPQRLVVYTEPTAVDVALINKDTAIRYRGGVKSDILADVNEGDEIIVLEEMEDWAKVETFDGIIGYVEVKRYDMNGTKEFNPESAAISLDYDSITFDGKVNMLFHQVFAENASDFTSDTDDVTGINVIAPTWFRLADSEGNINSIANSNYVNNAHAKGVKVWAVWTDVDKEVDLGAVLKQREKRRVLIDTMISKTQQYGIDGINLDFEKIPSDCGDAWAEFLRELSVETHAAGIVLSVDNYAPTASTMHYNRSEQGKVCDYVIIMGYDEHWSTSEEAGSVASLGFVEKGITDTAKEVPNAKIINAIPFYTRVWKTKDGKVTSDTMGMNAAKKWCNDNGIELVWDETTGQYYGEKEMNGILYQIWLEDSESIKTKLSVMSANNLAGVAEWKLGFEPSDIWNDIANYINS